MNIGPKFGTSDPVDKGDFGDVPQAEPMSEDEKPMLRSKGSSDSDDEKDM